MSVALQLCVPMDMFTPGLVPALANRSSRKSPASSVDMGTLPQLERLTNQVGTHPTWKLKPSRDPQTPKQSVRDRGGLWDAVGWTLPVDLFFSQWLFSERMDDASEQSEAVHRKPALKPRTQEGSACRSPLIERKDRLSGGAVPGGG